MKDPRDWQPDESCDFFLLPFGVNTINSVAGVWTVPRGSRMVIAEINTTGPAAPNDIQAGRWVIIRGEAPEGAAATERDNISIFGAALEVEQRTGASPGRSGLPLGSYKTPCRIMLEGGDYHIAKFASATGAFYIVLFGWIYPVTLKV